MSTDNLKKVFHDNLLKIVRGKKAIELASLLGVSNTFAYEMLSGKVNPSLEKISEYAKKLGVPAIDLLTSEAQKPFEEKLSEVAKVLLKRYASGVDAADFVSALLEQTKIGDAAKINSEIKARHVAEAKSKIAEVTMAGVNKRRVQKPKVSTAQEPAPPHREKDLK